MKALLIGSFDWQKKKPVAGVIGVGGIVRFGVGIRPGCLNPEGDGLREDKAGHLSPLANR